MKAEVIQQRSLLELAELDTELSRISHRSTHLAEHQTYDQVYAEFQAANDRLAVLRIALDDLNGQVGRLEGEIDSVRQREDRDRSLLESGTVNPKQLAELQHELETLERRQSSLEDSQLEVMERLEELQGQQAAESTTVDTLERDVAAARSARDTALAELDQTRHDRAERREQVAANLEPDLVALYERQRTASGVGAGLLQGRRCGACRIEIDQGEMSRIAAAPDDEVLRCPECGAILLRIKGA
jgi:uncharacterized protein